MSVPGFDVSKFQGKIDFVKAAAAGNAFCILKATEGVGFTDPMAGEYSAQVKAAGMIRGYYHFARPDLGNAPEAEAEYFYKIIEPGLAVGDILALDLESGNGDLLDWTKRWLIHCEKLAGYKPLLYGSPDWLDSHNVHNDLKLAEYGLWIAHYGTVAPRIPKDWVFWAIWQYTTSTGAVLGVNGLVDLDLFNGTREDMLKYGKPASTPPAPTPPTLDDARLAADVLTRYLRTL